MPGRSWKAARTVVRNRLRAGLGFAGRTVTRRKVILATVAGWVLVTAAVAVLASPGPALVLVLLAVGLLLANAMLSNRRFRVILGELRQRSGRDGPMFSGAAGGEQIRSEYAEVADRLKLTALALGKLSEDLGGARSALQQAVAREAARLDRRGEALQNLHAVVRVAGQIPSFPVRDSSPELTLRLVELLRTRRSGLVVGCGAAASTVWAALAVRQLAPEVRFVVLEHDPAVAARVDSALAAHGVADCVSIRRAPLTPVDAIADARGYQVQSWRDLDQIDVLFVDEQFAGLRSGGLPALGPLAGRLRAGGQLVVPRPGRWNGGEEVDRWVATGAWVLEEGSADREEPAVLRRALTGAAPAGEAPAPGDAGEVAGTGQSAPSTAEHALAAELARAARTVAGRPDPWVMVYHPVARTNPYQALLYSRALPSGFAPVAAPDFGDVVRVSDQLGGDPATVLHLHWLANVIDSAEDVDRAWARVDGFLSRLRQLQERQVRIIWTVHNRLPHWCDHPEAEIALRRELANLADVVHIMRPETVDEVGDLYRLPVDRLLVAPHPSYLGAYPTHYDRGLVRLELGLERDDFAVGLVGSIQPYKGVDELIEAVTGPGELPEGLRTIVAGPPGKDPGSVRVMERLAGTGAIQTLPQKLEEQRLARVLTALDAMVLPYRRPLTSGVAMLSLSFGVPIIAPGEGPFRPLAERGYCLTYDREEPGGLRAAIRAAPEWVNSVDREAMRKDMVSLSGAVVSEQFFTDLREALARARP